MRERIRTGGGAWTIRVNVQTNRPCNFEVIGNDPAKKNTKYFERRVLPVQKDNYVDFHVPYSPRVIEIIVNAKGERDDSFFEIDVEREKYRKPDLSKLKPEMRRAVKFIHRFSKKAGYLPINKMYSNNLNYEYIIHYLPKILDVNGNELMTSARISKYYPYVQASNKKLKNLSIPSREAIFFHEFSHLLLNEDPNNEKEADKNAVRIFRIMGYPKYQMIYAFDDIFRDDKLHNERLRNIKEELELNNNKN
jgi:hypothetical protein